MKVYCEKCGCLVAELAKGSRLLKNTVMICRKCYEKEKNPKRSDDIVIRDMLDMLGIK